MKMMNLNDVLVATEELKKVMGNISIDSIECDPLLKKVIFNLKPHGSERLVYYVEEGAIVKRYSDSYKNPWHQTVIREGK